jgi:hypothetical protein
MDRLNMPLLNTNTKYKRMKAAIEKFYKSPEHLDHKSYQSILISSLTKLMIQLT